MSESQTQALTDARSLPLTGASDRSGVTWRVTVPLGGALFLTMLPVTMLVPVLKETVAERFSVSTFWTHAFMSVNMMGAILAAPFVGWLTDRWGRRKPLIIWATLMDAGLLGSLGRVDTFSIFLSLRFLEGMAHIAVLTSLMALASDWAGSHSKGRVMGLMGACMMLGTSIGSPLGGLVGKHQPILVFELGAYIALGSALLMFLLVRETQSHSSAVNFSQAIQLLRHHRELAIPYVFSFIDRFCVGVLITTFMLYLSQVLNLPAQERGMAMAFFMLPFAAFCYPVGRWIDRWGRVWPMCVGSLLFGVVFAGYGWLSAESLKLVMIVSGVLSAFMFAPTMAVCADLTPPDQRGNAFAGFNMAGSLGFLLGPIFAGALCTLFLQHYNQQLSYRLVLIVTGSFEVICAVVALPFLLKFRRSGKIR